MNSTTSDWPMANTQHGMLVAFGELLKRHGVMDRLMGVTIQQKTRRFAPQTKLVEFLAGLMSGMEYLQDLNEGPHPLVPDRVVAHAWGQPWFTHYSTVSRTLDTCDEQTVKDVERVLTEFSRPFIATAVHELLRRGTPIVYDFDLTGQAVSSTSTIFEGVGFGWMDDSVRLGYQLARVCVGPRWHTALAGFHHPGDTVSMTCLKELVQAAEAHTNVRPRRRMELVQQRIEARTEVVARWQRLADQQRTKLERLHQTAQVLIGKVHHAQQAMPEANSPAKSARLTAQIKRWQKRQARLDMQIAKCQPVLIKHQTQLAEKVGQEFKYATLIHYRDEGVFPTLPVWFQHYNERQTIEAGNKEMRGTFHVQHLMSHSLAGIQIQVLFTGLAANAVRWCTPWLHSCSTSTTDKWERTLESPKYLVRVAANTLALVQDTHWGLALQFAPESPFPGVTLFVRGVPAFQLALGFNQPYRIESG